MAFISLICLVPGKSCYQEKYCIPIVERSANLFQFPSVCVSHLCTKWNSFADELYSSRKLLQGLQHEKKIKKKKKIVCLYSCNFWFYLLGWILITQANKSHMDYIKIIEIISWSSKISKVNRKVFCTQKERCKEDYFNLDLI